MQSRSDKEARENNVLQCEYVFLSVSLVRKGGKERKGKERKGKEQNGEKVAFVGVEPTPSAIRADVLSQLD